MARPSFIIASESFAAANVSMRRKYWWAAGEVAARIYEKSPTENITRIDEKIKNIFSKLDIHSQVVWFNANDATHQSRKGCGMDSRMSAYSDSTCLRSLTIATYYVPPC